MQTRSKPKSSSGSNIIISRVLAVAFYYFISLHLFAVFCHTLVQCCAGGWFILTYPNWYLVLCCGRWTQ